MALSDQDRSILERLVLAEGKGLSVLDELSAAAKESGAYDREVLTRLQNAGAVELITEDQGEGKASLITVVRVTEKGRELASGD